MDGDSETRVISEESKESDKTEKSEKSEKSVETGDGSSIKERTEDVNEQNDKTSERDMVTDKTGVTLAAAVTTAFT